MIVTAKRLGWDEKLTEEQKWDMDDYEHVSDDLEGELLQYTIKATPIMPAITVCLVGGQEADPKTVKKKDS